MILLEEVLHNSEAALGELVHGYLQQIAGGVHAPTMPEARRIAIAGLNRAMLSDIPCFARDAAETGAAPSGASAMAALCLATAARHRRRGVTLGMFLEALKGYRRAYHDLLGRKELHLRGGERYRQAVDRAFDQAELAVCAEWDESGGPDRLAELQQANRALTNEKNKYLAIFDSLNAPVILLDCAGRVDAINQAAAGLYGLPASPGAGYYGRLLRGQTVPWLGDALAALEHAGRTEDRCEIELETVAGRRYFEVTVKRLVDVGGRFAGTVALLNDITERQWAEEGMRRYRDQLEAMVDERTAELTEANRQLQRELNGRRRVELALRDSEWRYRSLVENAKDVVFTLSPEGRITSLNFAFTTITGWRIEEWLDRPIEALVHPEDIPFALERVRLILAGEEVRPAEIRICSRTGDYLVGEFAGAQQRCNGQVVGMLGIARDVTERKKAELALRASEERFAQFMHFLPGPAFIKDLQGRLVYVNENWKTLFGRQETADWWHRTDDELWPPPVARRIRDNDREVLASGQPRQTVEILQGNKGVVHRLINRFPILDDDGRPMLLGGAGIDITERVRAEEALVAYQQELSSLAAELSLAEERERRRIAGELHDQIGQSLAFVKLGLSSLAQGCLPAGLAGQLGKLDDVVGCTIQDVRSLTFQISPPLLYEVGLEAALEALGERFQNEHGFRVAFRDDGVPKPLDSEVGVTLYQVVRELLVNSAKHAAASLVTIAVSNACGTVEVVVEDDGCGFQAVNDPQRREKKGSFGLFNIRQRIGYLNGEVRIDSTVGVGTRVTVRVPLGNGELACRQRAGEGAFPET